jgi:hypothetical protein
MKYLFIDFDGVLHGEEFNTDYFENSPMLCSKLTPFKHLFKIVISSSWRETYDYDVCVEAFEESLRENIIGITPIHGIEGFDDEGRYAEILEYCTTHNISSKAWLAIDDMDRLFPKSCKNLILTNPLTGVTEDNINTVIKWLLSED